MSCEKPTTTLQTLSHEIAKKIVYFYMQSKLSKEQVSQLFETNIATSKLLSPLFSVCKNIHLAAQEYAFEKCKVDIETEQGNLANIKVNEQPWDGGIDSGISAEMFQLANSVDIDISCTGILDGSILKKIQQEKFSIMQFNKASKLKITLLGESVFKSLGQDDLLDRNVTEFVKYLKSLFSSLKRVDVLHVGHIIICDKVKDKVTTKLAALLYGEAESIGFSHSAPISSLLEIPELGKNLSGLYCNIGNNAGEFIQLIQRNASTLVSLEIVTSMAITGIDLVKNSDNNPVVYQKLKKLCYTQFGEPSPETENISREIAPFPSLEEFWLVGSHPFTDDTIFRSNKKTLSKITMDVDSSCARVINQYKTFADYKYNNLKTVKLIMGIGRTRLDSFPIGKLSSAAVDIAACSQILVLDSSLLAFSKRVAWRIRNTDCSQYLQVLNITGTRFTLPQIMVLLKKLTVLRKLYCEPNGLATADTKIDEKQHLAKAVAAVETQNRCLRYWKISSTKSHPVSTIAITIVLVALSCPLFQFADVPERIRSACSSFILTAIAEEPLASHADRLKTLVIEDI